MTGEMRTDLSGKIAALEPAFRFLAERTGREATASMMGLYTEHFVQQGLMMEAVNQTVREIVISWEAGYWPSPEYIAIRARQAQQAVMDELHGLRDRSREMDERAIAEREETWQHRRALAKAWFEAHPARGREIAYGVQRDLANLLRAMPNEGQFATNPAYRKAFEQGAIVGAVLREAIAPPKSRPSVRERMDARLTMPDTLQCEEAA